MWLEIKETWTYKCSCWRRHIMPRCKDRRIYRILDLCYHAIMLRLQLSTILRLYRLKRHRNVLHMHYALRVILILCVAAMRHDSEKGMKSSQRPYKENHDRKIWNMPLSLTTGQYVYLDRLVNEYIRSAWRLSVTASWRHYDRKGWDNRSITKDTYDRWGRNLKYCLDRQSYIGATSETGRTANRMRVRRTSGEWRRQYQWGWSTIYSRSIHWQAQQARNQSRSAPCKPRR